MITQTITIVNNYGVNLILRSEGNMLFSSSNGDFVFGIGTTTYTSDDNEGILIDSIGWDIYTEDTTIKVGELPQLGIGNSATVIVELNGDVEFNLDSIGTGGGGSGGGSSSSESIDMKTIGIIVGVIFIIFLFFLNRRKLKQFYNRIIKNKNNNESTGGIIDKFRKTGVRNDDGFSFY